LPEHILAKILDYIKSSHEAEKELHLAKLKELRAEDSNLADKLNRLTDLMIEGHVDPKIFEAKNKEISLRRREISCLLNDNVQADEKFKDALAKVVSLVGKSYELFDSSKTDERRGFLGFVFSNLQSEGTTLRYTLRKPFEVFAQLPQNPEWRPLVDVIRTRFVEQVLNLHKILPPTLG
jgi:hypothetical protein